MNLNAYGWRMCERRRRKPKPRPFSAWGGPRCGEGRPPMEDGRVGRPLGCDGDGMLNQPDARQFGGPAPRPRGGWTVGWREAREPISLTTSERWHPRWVAAVVRSAVPSYAVCAGLSVIQYLVTLVLRCAAIHALPAAAPAIVLAGAPTGEWHAACHPKPARSRIQRTASIH